MNDLDRVDTNTGPDETFWLDTPEQFEALGEPTRLEMLELLMRPHTVAEVAERMRVPRTRLYHHVNLLEETGMIRVVDTRRSGAVTEKIYQVTATSFQPSPRYLEEALPREQARAVMTSVLGATEADFVRAVDDGTISLRDKASARRLHVRRSLLLLDADRLDALVRDLEAVYANYEADPRDFAGPIDDDVMVVAALSVIHPSSRNVR